MKIISLNIGETRPHPGKTGAVTGIYKLPVNRRVELTELGLVGDVIVSKRHHGGPDQAVYIYGSGDYEWFRAEMGLELLPGTFGENITISELESAGYSVGDRLQAGSVTLEVTAPRIPCGTFAARMGDPGWVEKFRSAERPGLYCRVIESGFLEPGLEVVRKPYAGPKLTILEMFRDYYRPQASREEIQRYLDAPIAARSRVDKEKQLRRLDG